MNSPSKYSLALASTLLPTIAGANLGCGGVDYSRTAEFAQQETRIREEAWIANNIADIKGATMEKALYVHELQQTIGSSKPCDEGFTTCRKSIITVDPLKQAIAMNSCVNSQLTCYQGVEEALKRCK